MSNTRPTQQTHVDANATNGERRQPVGRLKRVAENLFRDRITDRYYGIVKVGGKQKKQSLKTTDPAIAKRRLAEFKVKAGRLASADAQDMRFAEFDADGNLVGGLAKMWYDWMAVHWAPTVKALAKHFGHLVVHNIGRMHVEAWGIARRQRGEASTFNRERLRLIEILGYAVDHHLLLDNPAREAFPKKLRETKYRPQIPNLACLARILAFMRSNAGKPDAKDSADLAEGLCYFGTRKGDANNVEWRHLNFVDGKILIAGDPATATKNHEQREIPMFEPARRLFLRMLLELPNPPKPTDKVFRVKSCRKAFETACKALGLPHYRPHHTWRCFFITHCLMAKIPPKVVAEWVGHKDGGYLVSKVYAVLLDEESERFAKQVTFDATAANQPVPTPSSIIPCPAAVND